MTTLIFLITVLCLMVLIISSIVKIIRRKPVKSTLRIIVIIVCGYSAVWLICFFTSSFNPVPLGTDVCFDDWCATIVNVEKMPSKQMDSDVMILQVTMSNHARGIAQKPSEPRIHIIDTDGRYWAYSAKAQEDLEKKIGKQPNIDARLQLGESLQTKLAFAVPRTAKGQKILIEEGPFITKFLFPVDQPVFIIQPPKQVTH